WMVLGVLGFGRKQASPSAAKARRASRTVWTPQPRAAAIREGRWPWSLARRTWQRRSVKESGERRPCRRVARSAPVKGRTNRGGFIPHCTHPIHHARTALCDYTRMILTSVPRPQATSPATAPPPSDASRYTHHDPPLGSTAVITAKVAPAP